MLSGQRLSGQHLPGGWPDNIQTPVADRAARPHLTCGRSPLYLDLELVCCPLQGPVRDALGLGIGFDDAALVPGSVS
jgi:hypothetical protein